MSRENQKIFNSGVVKTLKYRVLPIPATMVGETFEPDSFLTEATVGTKNFARNLTVLNVVTQCQMILKEQRLMKLEISILTSGILEAVLSRCVSCLRIVYICCRYARVSV